MTDAASVPKGAVVTSFGATYTGANWLAVITYTPEGARDPVDLSKHHATIHEAYNWITGKLVTHRQHTHLPQPVRVPAVPAHAVPADDNALDDDALLKLLLSGTTDYPSKIRLLYRCPTFCLVKFAPGKQWKSQLQPSVNCPPWVERYDAPYARMQPGRTVWKSSVDGKLLPMTIERLIEREKANG